ncbi:MAG: hypothetical protein ACLSCQ_10995 [Evtepia gabavorous]
MAQYLVKRVLGALPVFFGITLLVFFLMNMAPATIADLAGEAPPARPPGPRWRRILVWTSPFPSATCCG